MMGYIQQNDYSAWRATLEELYKEDQDKKIDPVISERIRQQVLERIQESDAEAIAPVHRVHFLRTAWFRYAAAVLVLIATGVTIYLLNHDNSEISRFARNDEMRQDIAPGTNRAILTVGNKTIDLATNKTGIAVGNVITYNDGEKITDASQLLQLTTPRGGQYQAVLPDGSKVWLNAASSIKFPSKFNSDSREVEITGEAYLEVAKNTKQPFFVHTNKTTVQVLGTSFNINAYEDEQTEKTTLIEGSISVISNGTMILKPGEQAAIDDNHSIKKNTVQTDEVTAWKSGLFSFNNVSLPVVMRQLERWYDIQVVYEGKMPAIEFYGAMSRNVSLQGVLKGLKGAGVNFRLENKKLIVTP